MRRDRRSLLLGASAAAAAVGLSSIPAQAVTGYAQLGSGLFWPYEGRAVWTAGSQPVLNAATNKCAFIGRLNIVGSPGSSKTLNTTGSSKIGFWCGSSVTFANGTTSIDIGIQGVSASAGPVAQPDGTFTVKSVVTTAANTTPGIATNTYCEATPTTGTATLSDGDLLSVVFDMTARGGADSVTVYTQSDNGVNRIFPTTNAFASSAWAATGSQTIPVVWITFSDGSFGFIDGCIGIGQTSTQIWTDSTNPDEQGMIFQVPFDCYVDAIWTNMRTADANSGFTLSLYSTPEATPSSLASVAVDAHQTGPTSSELPGVWKLASQVALTHGTDYCAAVKATGTSNLRMTALTLGSANHRGMFPAGTTVRNVSRNNSTGNFGSSSTTLMYPMGVRISQIPISASTVGGRIIGG